ncbi:TPA: DUF550 domain-containing protein [Klebsiella quasipneumoniae subsp. quasipneumoniae]|nr:DUF550 domain-containing protein [Klebsiella quasipneumoniae subsp. quasipneumoniae]
MTSKLTRERLEKIKSWRETYGAGSNVMLPAEEAEELARIALAAMDSEPVAWTWHYREQWHVTNDKCRAEFVAKDGDVAVLPLYRHAQTASERDQVRIAHAEWSQATFGNVGPVGPLKHLSKEALEAAAEPGDLSEWADMQFLLWDAQRRAGVTDEQITQAMIDKLAVNKQREWPEPKDGEPRLHIKEQPAPAFPDFDNVLESLDYEVRCNAWESEHVLKACQATYDACRAAMLQELQKSAGAEATCRSNKNVQVLHTKSPAQSDCCPAQNGDTPAQSQGWIPVSERMPEPGILVLVYTPPQPDDYPGDVRIGFDYIDPDGDDPTYWFNHGENYEHFYCVACDGMTGPSEKAPYTHWIPLPAAPQEVNHG